MGNLQGNAVTGAWMGDQNHSNAFKRSYNFCGDMTHKTCELQLLGRQQAHSAGGQWPCSLGHRKGKGDRGDQQTPKSCWNATGVSPKPFWFSLRFSEMGTTKTELLRRKTREQADADKGFADSPLSSLVTPVFRALHHLHGVSGHLKGLSASHRTPFSKVTSVGQ